MELGELEVGKKYPIKISNKFGSSDILNDSEDIYTAWEYIKENTVTSVTQSLGLYKLKQHKPWFDKKCLRFLDQRKQVKIQRLQDPNRSNIDNLNNVRREASRHFRNRTKEYLKAKVNELETSSKTKNIYQRHV
jgi:hypothetical protein